jgi:hypothetical protein
MENARKIRHLYLLKLHGSQKKEEVSQSSYDKSVCCPLTIHPSIHPSIALCVIIALLWRNEKVTRWRM